MLLKTLISRESITSDNYGPLVTIVTWIFLIFMVLSVCAKVAIKVTASHSFNADDTVLLAAMVIIPSRKMVS